MPGRFSYKRSSRIQELILEEVSKIIQNGLKDPRIGFATVTGVDLTDNLKHAKVYVSVMGSKVEQSDTLKGLSSATGFIRAQLAKNLHLKYIPELAIVQDNTPEEVEKISRIINQIHND